MMIMGPFYPCYQVSTLQFFLPFCIPPLNILGVCRMALVLIWAMDISACGVLLTIGTKTRKLQLFLLLINPPLFFFFHFPADIWSDHSFQTDPDLPPGWKRVSDIAGTDYWHIPTGTTQWERPVSIPADLQGSRKGSLSSVTSSPTPENEVK